MIKFRIEVHDYDDYMVPRINLLYDGKYLDLVVYNQHWKTRILDSYFITNKTTNIKRFRKYWKYWKSWTLTLGENS